MRKAILVLFAVISSMHICKAQTPTTIEWVAAMGGFDWDQGLTTVADNSGNTINLGSFRFVADLDPGAGTANHTSVGFGDIYLVKLDSLGDYVWSRSFGSTGSDLEVGVAVDNQDNIYMAGVMAGSADLDPGPGIFNYNSGLFVIKLDSAGNFIWGKNIITRFGAVAVDNTPEQNVIVSGVFQGNIDFDPGPGMSMMNSHNNGQDPYVLKLDSTGTFVWARSTIGYSGADGVNDMVVDSRNNIYTAGLYRDSIDLDPGPNRDVFVSGGGLEGFVQKLDSNGNYVWGGSIGSNNNDFIHSIDLDADDNLIMGGRFNGLVDFDLGSGTHNKFSLNGQTETFILKVDSARNFEWVQSLGLVGLGNQFQSIATGLNGSVYYAGLFNGIRDFDPGPAVRNLQSVGATDDIFVLKLDQNGDYVWAEGMGNAGLDNAASVRSDDVGNFYLTGYFQNTVDFDPDTGTINRTAIGSADAFLMKISDCITEVTVDTAACDSFFYDGVKYTTTGTYEHTFTNIYGCDSIVTLRLSVYRTITTNITQTACDSFQFGDSTYFVTGIYADTSVSPSTGCRNIIDILDLTILNSTASTTTVSACDSFIFNGVLYDSSATYTQVIPNAQGCDSVLTLNLTINHPTAASVTASACDSLEVNGTTYYTSGTYNQTLTNSNGCDSLLTLHLTINQPTTSSFTETACDSFSFNGITYQVSGTYHQTLVNSQGCDSLITLNLTINHPTSSSFTETACDSFSFNTTTYYTSGIYNQTLTNTQGCDSLITLTLTIHPTTTSSFTEVACDSFSFNGTTYTTSGTYTQTLTNVQGCDSILTLNLTINESIINDLGAVTSCGNYELNGQVYTMDGDYTQPAIGSALGCDSIIRFSLAITDVDTSVTPNTLFNSLTADQSGATYQWLDCNNNFTPINDATDQEFIPENSGSYAVEITLNNCKDTSHCFEVTTCTSDFELYPNPTRGPITVYFCEEQRNMTAELYTHLGQLITSKKIEATKEVTFHLLGADGLYYIKLINEEGAVTTLKFEKF